MKKVSCVMFLQALLSIVLHISCSFGLSKSKLSIFSGMGDLSWTFINNGKPKLVKIFDSFNNNENAEKIKNISSDIIIIGRIYQSNQPQTGDPQIAAYQWWYDLNQTILANPSIDYWEV